MQPHPRAFFQLLLIAALLSLIAPGSAPARAEAPLPGQYLFVEIWFHVDGVGHLPSLCIDFPGYAFDQQTGRLAMFFQPLPALAPGDGGFAGRGEQRSGAAGCGVGSHLATLASLPYTTTVTVGTGGTTGFGEERRAAPVVLQSVDGAGTLTADIDGERVTLAPGERWSRLVEADLVNQTYNGHYVMTSSVTNYGWQLRALIQGQQQFVWMPLVRN